MDLSRIPLNALRAFEASARLQSFTRAGLELRVSQTAVSHQVKSLEETLRVPLFKRGARGVTLTDEGQALLPVLSDAFRRMSDALNRLEDGNFREILTIGVVSSFATGWLLSRLRDFSSLHPHIDIRLKTNNNRADLLTDGLDCFIRFGDGSWHGTEAVALFGAKLFPVCAPEFARLLRAPADLLEKPLLRSYRLNEWALWFQSADLPPPHSRGWMFDTSLAIVDAAAQGAGIGLVPVRLFERDLESGRIVQPFDIGIETGGYWLTWLKSREETAAMQTFRSWLKDQAAAET
ncbi:LysR family transcriptional regulator [uncultured Roseibium sp.]|uniref:LysR family transcriptional regulator n=1 Tax=uncultured Roseibium sp. TaxID=1936171 RepID=UPI002639C241|nr:LysR family transcriptional regulator [uncultured Roseibium sp.]